MERRRSLEESSPRVLGDAALQGARELDRRCAAVKKEEVRAIRRHDKEIEAMRHQLDDLMRQRTAAGATAAPFGNDEYAGPVVLEARQRSRQLPATLARAEQELASLGATAVPQLALEGSPPRERTKRSMSLPSVPAHIERLSSERMPGSGPALFGAFGTTGGTEGHLLQVPGAAAPPLRKRSIDFSQLSSLGVIRESE